MKKIVILGSGGMSGHIIGAFFKSKGYNVISIDEKEIIYDDYEINIANLKHNADYVINCIRCLVDDSENNTVKAIKVNSYLPKIIENLYQNTSTKVVQLSTDCVFLGSKGGYDENSYHDGTNFYSRSKSLGELNNSKDITIRSSYIGPTLLDDSEELFDWFMTQNRPVRGFKRAFWNGVTTLELAKSIRKLLQKNFFGVYHLIGEKKISKYTLLTIINSTWNKNIEINEDSSFEIDRSLLDTKKIIEPKAYKKMFQELHQYMALNSSMYTKYL